MPLMEAHLARHSAADLFVDTSPYSAHTTIASDALWAGLPVLTCAGEAFAGRVAASLSVLDASAGTHRLDAGGVRGLAIELAANPERLRQIRQKLKDNRLTAPLFDTKLYARHIEAAYTAMSRAVSGGGVACPHICQKRGKSRKCRAAGE